MHTPDGTDRGDKSAELRLRAAEPRSHGRFRTQALLKSALALIKNNGCKREEGGEEKKKEANPRWIPHTNLFSSASKLPFDLQGAERFLGAGEMREGQDQLPNC